MNEVKKVGWLFVNSVQLVITLVFSMLGIILALVIRLLFRDERVPLRMASWMWSPVLIYGAPARFKVEGREQIDFSRPQVFIANHQSMIDICALFMALPVPVRFMLKAELGRLPFLGWYTRSMGMVLLERGRPGLVRRQLTQAVDLLQEGHSLCAFPEGTRSLDGTLSPFKNGIFRVAIRAGVPVVPVAISGTGQVMPPGGFHIRPGHIRVKLGRPIETAGLNLNDDGRLAEQSRREIQSLLEAC